MRQIHAPELEDEVWLPSVLRDSMTAVLQVLEAILPVFDSAAPLLQGLLDRHRSDTVIDLCSGGGGPLIPILERLVHTRAIFTDLYPNLAAFQRIEQRLGGRARGFATPVDAANVPTELDGVRTIFNGLHHMRPDGVKKILHDAATKQKPLCIVEAVERDAIAFALVALMPLAVVVLIPFTKPSLAQLALTYLLPILPLLALWDGLASCLRAYSIEELQELAESVPEDGYRCTVGRGPRGRWFPMRMTWLIGEPVR